MALLARKVSRLSRNGALDIPVGVSRRLNWALSARNQHFTLNARITRKEKEPLLIGVIYTTLIHLQFDGFDGMMDTNLHI